MKRLALLPLALWLGACSTTAETDTPTPTASGPVAVSLSLALSPLGRCAGGSQVSAVEPRGEPLLLVHIDELMLNKGTSTAAELILRAPGACGSLSPCGHFLALIDGNPVGPGSGAVATRTFEVPLSGLAQPFGPHQVELRLLDDEGRPVPDPAGKAISSTLSVDILSPDDPSCVPQ